MPTITRNLKGNYFKTKKIRKNAKWKTINIFIRNIKISSFELQDKIIAGHGQSTETKANQFDTTKHNK